MVKIALCGKMASGKTTVAERFINEWADFKRVSLAQAVKDFGRFLFDIPEGHKDRVAFQKVGDGARKFIHGDVWLDAMLNMVEMFENESSVDGDCLANFVVDDVRYHNEVLKLKSEGWTIVKLDVDDELQLERLKATYPNDWETHAEARSHPSEAEVDSIPLDLFDMVVNVSNDDNPYLEIVDLIATGNTQ